MNSGEAAGENRIRDGIDKALDSPLLNNNDIHGAKRVLLYAYSSQDHDITMSEVSKIEEFLRSIQNETEEIEVIWGLGYDDNLGDAVRVTIIATGFGLDGITDEPDDDKMSIDERRERDYKRYYDENGDNSGAGNSQTDEIPEAGLDDDSPIVDLDDWDDIDTPAYRRDQ